MTNLVNHPGMFLNDAAAASLAKMEKEHGIFILSDAGRTIAQQQELINRWNQGGPQNRPPYLYQPAMPASASPHVKNGGEAIDLPHAGQRDWIKRWGAGYGWSFPLSWDVVHCVYNINADKSRIPASPSGDQDVKNRQTYLNVARQEQLVVDGIAGPATLNAIKRYQTYLTQRGFYAGTVDGIWGPQTEAAHAKNVKATEVVPPITSVTPTGLKWNGIQEMLKAKYAYVGNIDGIAGPGTVSAFQRFLNANAYSAGTEDGKWGDNTAKAGQRWLAKRYGYTGAIDGIYGPATRTAWAKAEAANAAAF